MSKQFLQETFRGNFVLQESTKKDPSKCLGTMKGPCADYKNPTRNGNFYSRKLWENVFNNDLVKESLEDKVLLGELDHPGDGRLETKAANACIVMTDYEFDDNDQVVIGTFDILPTPTGHVLKSLLDYGCKIGVSSRGEGDIETIDGINHVDEEGFEFVAFDAVTLPAVKKAKPSLHESIQRKGLRESLASQIESATTKAELDLIENVIKTTAMPELDSLLESINIKSNQIEGTNGSSNLVEDLESSTREITRLEEENKSLTRELINCKARLKKFVTSRLKMSESYSQLDSKHKQLEADHEDLKAKFSAKSRKVESLETELQRATKLNERLKANSKINRSAITEGQDKISSLEESLERSQRVCQAQISKNKELQSTIASLEEQLSQIQSRLDESLAKEKRAHQSLQESKRRASASLKGYAKQVAESRGIDPQRVFCLLKEGMTATDVDKIVQEEVSSVDRYSKINRTNDPVLESLARNAHISMKGNTVAPQLSTEDQESLSFVRQFYQKKS